MERLKFFDQMLYKVEESGLAPLDMQGVIVLDPATTTNRITPKALADHLAARFRDVPILRKKLVQDPLKIGDIKLIDHPGYDPLEHFTFRTLPAPGDQRALSRAIGEFSAQRLDHSRPPWRYEIVDGLEGGRIAVFTKLSHATMDGKASVRLSQQMFDSEPKPLDKYIRKTPVSSAEPSTTKLLEHALLETGYRLFISTPRAVYQLSKAAGSKAGSLLIRGKQGADGEEESEDIEKVKPPRTSLNQDISTDNRNVAYVNYDFDGFKALSKALSCTLNDLCLLLVSEGFTHYFRGIGERIDGDLVLGVPLSTRAEDDQSFGNDVGLGMVNIHTTIADLRDRLGAIKRETGKLKLERAQTKLDDGLLGGVFDALSPIVMDLLLGVMRSTRLWNKVPTQVTATLSNVPGPRGDLYLAGMPVEYSVPMIPVFHACAVSVGATSIGSIFSIGFHVCGNVVSEENIHYLVDGVNESYEKLSAEVAPVETKQRRTTRKAVPGRAKSVPKPKPKTKTKPKTRTKTKTKPKSKKEAKLPGKPRTRRAKAGAGSKSGVRAGSGAKKTVRPKAKRR